MNITKKYLIPAGSILFAMLAITNAVQADQQIQDDLVVVGSICAGFDCVNGESFGFDTLRLKENNLRIKLIDTSSSSSFPTRDWQITVNDSINGGANWFGIEDLDAGTTPFTILASAPNDSLYISSNGNIGLGTTTPLVDLNIKAGNTPTLRLEQDTSSGFAEQTWDIGGNEANFFVRDVSNGSALPLRIMPAAPNGSLHIAADGDIGFETTTPDGQFDVAHSGDGNNHAFLISPVSDVGINIDNGFLPNGLFEIQTTGGISRFLVKSDGNVGIGTKTPSGRFDVRDTADNLSYLNVDANGNVGIGTPAPAGRFDVRNTANSLSYLNVNADGNVGIGTNAPVGRFDVRDTAGSKFYFALDAEGDVGIGTNTPIGRFEVRGTNPDTTTESSYFDIDAKGNVSIGPNEPIDSNATYAAIDPTAALEGRLNVKNIAGDLELLTLSDLGKLVAKGDVCTMLGGTETCLSTAGGSGGGSSNTWDPWAITDNSGVLSFAYNGGSTLLTLDSATGDLTATGDVCGSGGSGGKCVNTLRSSKYLKNIYSVVDSADILEKVSSLPISLWSYKDDDAKLHIGPMAEDFQATFGLNGDITDKIAIVDAVGVALTSIQALHSKTNEKDFEIQQLKKENAQIKEKLASLELKLNQVLSIQ